MAEKAKWCFLCDRYVVPTKHFSSIGWVGFAATLSLLVAAAFNGSLSQYIQMTPIAASIESGIGNIILNVLLLLVLPLLVISIIYSLYWAIKKPRCPICNSRILKVEPKAEPTVVKAESDIADAGQIE
ncbi:MAG: hypothetical protein ACXV44_07565 [Halobacteriota archaeon]